MVELDFCLLSADVISADRLEVRNEVTSSWSEVVTPDSWLSYLLWCPVALETRTP